MRCRWDRSRTGEAGGNVREDSILPILLRRICDFSTGVYDRHVRAGSVTVPVMVRITATNQRGKGKTAMFRKDAAESPATGNGAHKVMPAAINWQLIVTGYAQALAHVEVGIAFVDGLREWVGLLKADLIRREVDGMAPGVEGRNGEAARKGMRKLSDHRVEASVDVRKRYEDSVKAIVADDNGRGTGGILRTARESMRAGALGFRQLALE